MVIPTNQKAYSQAQGTSTIPYFIFEDRDPTTNDIKYPLYSAWVNTLTKGIWYLEAFNPTGGFILAQWRAVAPIVLAAAPPASPLTASSDYSYPIGQTWCDTSANTYFVMVNNPTATTGYWIKLSAGGQSIEEFEVDASSSPGTDPVVPDTDGIVTVTGGQVAAATTANVIQTNSLAANTYTIQVQRSKTEASSTVGSNGVSHYDENHFSVDANGFVQLKGGEQAIDSVDVDAHSAPGTDPVVPDANGTITVTGGQVAAGTTANVIRTDSLAANTYTIEVQRSTTAAASTVGSNGVSHFDSAYFSVDSDGFVSMAGGTGSFTPTIAFGGGSTGITYAVQEGKYLKIGNAVYISIYLDISSTGTDTGNLTIEGLPFTVGSPSSQIIQCQIDDVQFDANYNITFGRPITSASNIEIWESGTTTATAATNINQTNLSTSPAIRIQGFYFV